MIDRSALLSDLQSLLKRLEADLQERSESEDVSEVGEWLRAEYEKAKKSQRTAQTFKQWVDDFITQVAAAWVLSCVFVRFLEDNELIDPPRIAGAKNRLDRARDEHTLFFQDAERAKLTDREYLLDIFDRLAQSSAGKDVFGPHNPLRALPNWLGPDAAGELLRFFQKIDSDSGQLVHDFCDSDWDTRFLGDLYQDLSEAARKKYALLQTPDFVEEFILDRTLEPALDEFGLKPETAENSLFKMIDPACGSGHFLLGSFPRILSRWQKEEPGTNIRVLVQRTLDSIHGVDVNPYAIAIARFRLLLAALAACGVKRLADAPAFAMNLACGDSLYHGRRGQLMLGDDWTDEAHYFQTEDADELRRILKEGTFHCVVANPPYITPKDKAANKAYRRLYPACHMKYSLAVPFMDRIYTLALGGNDRGANAGFTGQITANSFMSNEFGKKLIEELIPKLDLTHIVDTRFAKLEGHGTPTVILFGRNRVPTKTSLRAVLGIRGEQNALSDSAAGTLWQSMLRQIDEPGSESEYFSARDMDRGVFGKHPWSIGGGGASELKQRLDENATHRLKHLIDSVGFMSISGEDDAFAAPLDYWRRNHIRSRRYGCGDTVRDWQINTDESIAFMYDNLSGMLSLRPLGECGGLAVAFWANRTNLRNRLMFGKLPEESGLAWYEYRYRADDRLKASSIIAYAYKATHNHFVLDRGTTVFNQTAPVVECRKDATTAQRLELLAVLNSSTAAFWERQVHRWVSGAGNEKWEVRLERNGTKVQELPLPDAFPKEPARFDALANSIRVLAPSILSGEPNIRARTHVAKAAYTSRYGEMIRLQEDLDWECYRLYGLLEDDLTYPSEGSLEIQLGERAFEIVLARKLAAGEVQTTWFERHGSTPITELPADWPDDYRQLVERRIAVIESNPQIALIEQPEYKRRWNTEPWDSQVERALRAWLLDRLESYFDFDGRMRGEPPHSNPLPHGGEGASAPLADIQLVSVSQLADVARQDAGFMEVAEVYRDDPAFDVLRLVEELVQAEHVPLLPVLRYKPSGLRKREQWEETWNLQRQEDSWTTILCHEIRKDHQMASESDTLLYLDIDWRSVASLMAIQQPDEADDEKEALTDEFASQLERQFESEDDIPVSTVARFVNEHLLGDIPVPPKYTSADFISTGGARYWSLRGKLDVPKERWSSFPHCEGPDGTLMIAWAGYNHLQQATAIAAYFVRVKEELGGADDPRLLPLLSALVELLPWLKQWHNDIDPEFGMPMGDYFAGFVQEEARALQKTIDDLKAWQPPARKKKAARKKTARKKATRKKAAE